MVNNPLTRFGVFLALVGVWACGGGNATNSGASSPSPRAGETSQASAPARSSSAGRPHYESVVEMLRGQVPGLEIIEVDGSRIEVRIRGLNQSLGAGGSQEPLVVVDGMPQSRPAGEVLMALNPKDVASITVLKDVASTSIYGTRGANGVIVVLMNRRP